VRRGHDSEPGLSAPGTSRSQARLSSIAGPLLICGTALLVLHGYAFQGLISIKHPDLLPFWYPTWCYLGKSLAAGHIAAWNPHVMGGVPFAADPQSGWGYLPAMALFSALPCGVAIRWVIVLQPIIAGLGLYAFLRSEGLTRAAATVGGLALALGVAGSGFVDYVPFSGMFAWTAVLLACASRLFRSTSWPARIGWLAATSLAWGQLAAAHLSQGLLIGTSALLVYAVVRISSDLRTHAVSRWQAVGVGSLLLVSLPLVNLAILLPRLLYLPETSLGHGYRTLQILIAELSGGPVPPPVVGGFNPKFPLSFSVPGGVYLGAVVLGLVFTGWRARRLRRLWVSMAAYALISYLLGLHLVVKAVAPAIIHSGFMQSLYSHAQHRLGWGLVLALPILGAVGVDGWRERSGPAMRAAMVGPAVVVWVIVPLALGLHRQASLLPGVGALVAALVLGVVAARRSVVVLIPLLVAAELSVNGLFGIGCCTGPSPPPPTTIEAFQPGHRPDTPAAAYERAGPIVRSIQNREEGRYLSIDPALWVSGESRWAPRNWPFMSTQRSMLFGIEEAQGYNPAQLMRYWTFLRAVQREPIVYNAAFFERLEPLALNLLQVAYLIQPSDEAPAVQGSTPVAVEGAFTLYRLPDVAPRASVVTAWTVAGSANRAREQVLQPGFDPNASVVLEKNPGLPASGSGGSARYIPMGDQAAKVYVETTSPGLVLVRDAFEPNWHATLDGRPANVLAADSLIQAVPVGAGRHVVLLAYDDPTIGWGLLGSALSLLALLLAVGVLIARERSQRRSREERAEVSEPVAP
jgi:hypothetical protein